MSVVGKGSTTSGGIRVAVGGGHLEDAYIPQVKSHHLSARCWWPGEEEDSSRSPASPQNLMKLILLDRMCLGMSDLLTSHNFAVLPATCLPFWVCRHVPLLPQQLAAGPG